MSQESSKSGALPGLAALTIGAVGVVYGDIGTSPLYAVNEIFSAQNSFEPSPIHALQAISMIFWALTLLISLEYIIFVLRADHDGEGGVFALLALLGGRKSRRYRMLTGLLLLSAGFLYGDGIITPAISVLSAMEGLNVATKAFVPYILPLTLLILTVLFAFQYKGTARMGAVFGPVMITWFLLIAVLGGRQVLAHPQILQAVNPLHVIGFFREAPLHTIFSVLGSVMLVITGGEALYADMGHFGRIPIRLGWVALVFPCLLLNYFGQGAYILSGQPIQGGNVFYSLVPHTYLYPVVALATATTIIASQALITGIFSLTSQATKMGFLPKFTTIHTNPEHAGQIYQPALNWFLYIGCILLVLIFKASTNLAVAYGLTVSALMCITALCMRNVARDLWSWSGWVASVVFGTCAGLYAVFLIVNSLKFIHGGYLPIILGFALFASMTTWAWGKDRIRHANDAYVNKTLTWVRTLRQDPSVQDLPRAVAFLTSRPLTKLADRVPSTFFFFFQKYGALPKHLIFLHALQSDKNYVPKENRYEIFSIAERVTAITLHYGFMEQMELRSALADLYDLGHIPVPPEHWIIEVRQNATIVQGQTSFLARVRIALFGLLNSVSSPEHAFFELGSDAGISTQLLPVELSRSQFHFPELDLVLQETDASSA